MRKVNQTQADQQIKKDKPKTTPQNMKHKFLYSIQFADLHEKESEQQNTRVLSIIQVNASSRAAAIFEIFNNLYDCAT